MVAPDPDGVEPDNIIPSEQARALRRIVRELAPRWPESRDDLARRVLDAWVTAQTERTARTFEAPQTLADLLNEDQADDEESGDQ